MVTLFSTMERPLLIFPRTRFDPVYPKNEKNGMRSLLPDRAGPNTQAFTGPISENGEGVFGSERARRGQSRQMIESSGTRSRGLCFEVSDWLGSALGAFGLAASG